MTKIVTIEFRKGDSLKSLIEKLLPYALDARILDTDNDHRCGWLEEGIFEIVLEEINGTDEAIRQPLELKRKEEKLWL